MFARDRVEGDAPTFPTGAPGDQRQFETENAARAQVVIRQRHRIHWNAEALRQDQFGESRFIPTTVAEFGPTRAGGHVAVSEQALTGSGDVAGPLTAFFNADQQDALTELVNIAVSGAAVRLRGMVGSEIHLTVPAVALVPPVQADDAMMRLGLDQVVAVRQPFDGTLSGETLLLFPEETSRRVISLILDGVPPEEAEAMQDDALQEVGNVLLTGFLSTVGNMLRRDFEVGIPQVTRTATRGLFSGDDSEVVLLIYVNFSVGDRTVKGYFAMVLGLPSLIALRGILDAFILQTGA